MHVSDKMLSCNTSYVKRFLFSKLFRNRFIVTIGILQKQIHRRSSKESNCIMFHLYLSDLYNGFTVKYFEVIHLEIKTIDINASSNARRMMHLYKRW